MLAQVVRLVAVFDSYLLHLLHKMPCAEFIQCAVVRYGVHRFMHVLSHEGVTTVSVHGERQPPFQNFAVNIWAVQLVIRVSRLPYDRALSVTNTQCPLLCTQSLTFVDNKHCLSWTRLIAVQTRWNVTLDASRKHELCCLPHTCSSMQHGCLSTSNRLEDRSSTRRGYRKHLPTLTVKQTEAATCMQRKKVQEEACRRKARGKTRGRRPGSSSTRTA